MRLTKKKKKQASRIRMPKKENSTPVVRRKNKAQPFKIFKRKKGKFSTRRKAPINLKYIAIPLLFLFITGIAYASIRFVLYIRNDANREQEYEKSDVLGLDSVIAYKDSEFLFINNMDDPIVKEFLSQGNSAYKLPLGTTTQEVEDFYKEELEKSGWEFVQSVPMGTADKKYGQYWIKDGKGLRIYSKFKDIWYETITEENARNALADLVKEEIEREMLMASSEKQDLLPDYPWRIQIPKEYNIKYYPTEMKDLRAVSFQKLGGDDIVEIFPVGYWKAKELDYMLNDYCEIKSTEEVKYGVMNSIPISFRDSLGLKSSIKTDSGIFPAYVVPNTFNSVVYIFFSNKENNPLLEYVLENIKPLGAKD